MIDIKSQTNLKLIVITKKPIIPPTIIPSLSETSLLEIKLASLDFCFAPFNASIAHAEFAPLVNVQAISFNIQNPARIQNPLNKKIPKKLYFDNILDL